MVARHHFTTIVSLIINQKDRQKHRRIGECRVWLHKYVCIVAWINVYVSHVSHAYVLKRLVR